MHAPIIPEFIAVRVRFDLTGKIIRETLCRRSCSSSSAGFWSSRLVDLIITMVLYGGVMLTPPEARATVVFSPKDESEFDRMNNGAVYQETIIETLSPARPHSLFNMGTGSSPCSMGPGALAHRLNAFVLPALLNRTPITLELTLYSLLFLIPLGLVSGVLAGWKRSGLFDQIFRSAAFLSTTTPTFILRLVFISVFYINLGWFAPGRMSLNIVWSFRRIRSIKYTGMLTIDSLLNGRLDIFVDAWQPPRHAGLYPESVPLGNAGTGSRAPP